MKKMRKASSGELIFGLVFIFFLASGVMKNTGGSLEFQQTIEKIKVFVEPEPETAITIKNAPLYALSDKSRLITHVNPNTTFDVLESTRFESNGKIAMVKVDYEGKQGWLSTADVRLESQEITNKFNKNNN